jgi:hypothetical protein
LANGRRSKVKEDLQYLLDALVACTETQPLALAITPHAPTLVFLDCLPYHLSRSRAAGTGLAGRPQRGSVHAGRRRSGSGSGDSRRNGSGHKRRRRNGSEHASRRRSGQLRGRRRRRRSASGSSKRRHCAG